MLEVLPNSRNTIPGEAFFTIDLRHPDDAALSNMAADMREFAAGVALEAGLELDLREIFHAQSLRFDDGARRAITNAAEALGMQTMDIVSGAGHDACNIARVAPTAMIFVPCADGISHNETESATPEDVTAGCDVLLNAMLGLANAG
jgi:N-carbamoyl-L-amino-acid hydrolase